MWNNNGCCCGGGNSHCNCGFFDSNVQYKCVCTPIPRPQPKSFCFIKTMPYNSCQNNNSCGCCNYSNNC